MTSHANCTHPATKAARAACRKDRATTPAMVRPTLYDGSELFCELCARDDDFSRYYKLDDMRHIPCPCGRIHDDGSKMPYGARYILRRS
jgi:hypothetical protein